MQLVDDVLLVDVDELLAPAQEVAGVHAVVAEVLGGHPHRADLQTLGMRELVHPSVVVQQRGTVGSVADVAWRTG